MMTALGEVMIRNSRSADTVIAPNSDEVAWMNQRKQNQINS